MTQGQHVHDAGQQAETRPEVRKRLNLVLLVEVATMQDLAKEPYFPTVNQVQLFGKYCTTPEGGVYAFWCRNWETLEQAQQALNKMTPGQPWQNAGLRLMRLHPEIDPKVHMPWDVFPTEVAEQLARALGADALLVA